VEEFVQTHYDQIVTVFLPLGVLLADVVFKTLLGNRVLHPFGGDMALCGFVLYLVAVLNIIPIAPEQPWPAIASKVFGIVGALTAWFITLLLRSFERWWPSLFGAFLGLCSSALCVESAWSMLTKR